MEIEDQSTAQGKAESRKDKLMASNRETDTLPDDEKKDDDDDDANLRRFFLFLLWAIILIIIFILLVGSWDE